jgi:F0F1-type ATP synthase membrane subunit b/b'
MSDNSKHLATFLLGVAAGVAATKYISMTPEEKEKMIASLKEKANKIKGEAESGFAKAKECFEELKAKGGDALKDHFGELSGMMHHLFSEKK